MEQKISKRQARIKDREKSRKDKSKTERLFLTLVSGILALLQKHPLENQTSAYQTSSMKIIEMTACVIKLFKCKVGEKQN